MSRHLALAALALTLAAPAQASPPAVPPAEPQPAQRTVLITGASSGFGRAATELLASKGWFVYAGARSQEDLDALNKIRNVKAIRLDVTRPYEIYTAAALVRAEGRGLYGLVNNAGVGGAPAPLNDAEERDLTYVFDVNVYGPWRVTKAFAPLLAESKGRIVNISSICAAMINNALIFDPYRRHFAQHGRVQIQNFLQSGTVRTAAGLPPARGALDACRTQHRRDPLPAGSLPEPPRRRGHAGRPRVRLRPEPDPPLGRGLGWAAAVHRPARRRDRDIPAALELTVAAARPATAQREPGGPLGRRGPACRHRVVAASLTVRHRGPAAGLSR